MHHLQPEELIDNKINKARVLTISAEEPLGSSAPNTASI